MPTSLLDTTPAPSQPPPPALQFLLPSPAAQAEPSFSTMQAISRGWQQLGRPVVAVAARVYFSQRLDLALALTLQAVVPGPPGLGVALGRVARLVIAARVARRSQQRTGDDAAEAEESGKPDRGGQGGAPPAAAAGPQRLPRSLRKPGQAPKGLGGGLGMPPVVLPAIPPGEALCL